jgi:hypothetical protein
MDIMHGVPVKLGTVLSGMLVPRGERAVVSLAIVEVMVHVPVEVLRSMEPGSGTDEYATREPLRAIVTIGRAIIRRSLVISVRTNRRFSDADCNLCIRLLDGS